MAFFDFSVYGIIYRFAELTGAPFQNPGIIWFGLPLILTLTVIELNFPRKNWEEHDLRQALPNAIVLLFVSIDLARVVFGRGEGFFATLFSSSFLSVFVVFLLAVTVFLIDYYFEFPRKLFFEFSAHLPINTLAYALMVVVYTGTGFDINSVFAAMLFFVLLWFLLFVGRHIRIVPEEKKKDYRTKFSFGEPKEKKFDFYPGTLKKELRAEKKNDNLSDTVDIGSSKLKWLKKEQK